VGILDSSGVQAARKGAALNHSIAQSSVFALSGKLSAASSAGVNAIGQPTQKFTKDLIRTGQFYKSSTDQSFTITQDNLNGFAAEFAKMKAAGIKIPVPEGHTNAPSANRGYVEDMFVDGDTLHMTCELIGEDAIKLAGRAQVSIYAVPEHVDDKRNVYRNVIEHVAIVTDPVISGQGGFVPVELSRGTIKALAYSPAPTGASSMIQKIAAALGIKTEGMDESGIESAILAKIESMKPKAEAPTAEAVKAARKEAEDAKAELTALKLSRTTGETNPVVVRMAGENRTMKLSRLVEGGNITPATRDRLAACWIGSDNANLRLSLDDDNDRRFTEMCKALAENDPKVLGEKTMRNGVALSRETPGDGTISDADASKAAADRAARINKGR